MSQNRDAPAYQEYAANNLAQLPFRAAKLQDRGLIYTLKLECWVNRELPADPGLLAIVLGQPADEVAKSLPAALPFFKVADGKITCPELDAYRAHLEERHAKQSKGGKDGAEITNKKLKRAKKPVDADVSGKDEYPDGYPAEYPDGVLVQSSTEQQSQNHPARRMNVIPINTEIVKGDLAGEIPPDDGSLDWPAKTTLSDLAGQS